MDSDSSGDDDDDIYVSGAARLKALKKKAPIERHDSPKVAKEDVDSDYWSSKTPLPLSQSTLSSSRLGSGQRRSPRIKRDTREPSPELEITSIEIPDDDDEEEADAVMPNSSLDSLNLTQDLSGCIEDDNYIVVVKVKWKSRAVVRLELKKYESFQKIFQHFAKLEDVSEKQILIFRNNKQIHRTDTPASLDLKVIDILEGGIIKAPLASDQNEIEDAEDMCKIKVQMSTKQKIVVDLKMDETFKTVVLTCAQQLNVAPSQIKLSFDGDEITLTDTPESLDLEQEACIDLRVLRS